MNKSGLNLGVLNPATAQAFGSEQGQFVLLRHRWDCHPEDEGILPVEELEVVFIKMPRPAAPQGSEWNVPGGVLKIGEGAASGMTREWKEELLGMQVLATTVLPGVQQYASGSFREWYYLGVLMAVGEPKPSYRSSFLFIAGAVMRRYIDLSV